MEEPFGQRETRKYRKRTTTSRRMENIRNKTVAKVAYLVKVNEEKVGEKTKYWNGPVSGTLIRRKAAHVECRACQLLKGCSAMYSPRGGNITPSLSLSRFFLCGLVPQAQRRERTGESTRARLCILLTPPCIVPCRCCSAASG